MNINEQETKDMLQLENLFYELQDNYYKLAVYITNEYKTKDGVSIITKRILVRRELEKIRIYRITIRKIN